MDGFNFSAMQYTNSFFCMIDGDDIVQTDGMGNRKVIGKKLETYNELEQTTSEYYNKLVELGVIVPPKTPEEQNKELQATLSNMADMMASLKSEIEELKNNEHKCNCANGGKDVSKRKNNGSSQSSATNDTGCGEHSVIGTEQSP